MITTESGAVTLPLPSDEQLPSPHVAQPRASVERPGILLAGLPAQTLTKSRVVPGQAHEFVDPVVGSDEGLVARPGEAQDVEDLLALGVEGQVPGGPDHPDLVPVR